MIQRNPTWTASDVQDAIESSGYPLQLRVAAILESAFEVMEEWGYVDRTTGDQRTLDLQAFRRVPPSGSGKIRPGLALLVECKRSMLPYVFFKSSSRPRYTHFPQIDGIPDSITVMVQRDERAVSSHVVPMAGALGLFEETFVAEGPLISATFSKIVRQSDHFELSGSKPYHDLLLPLISAMRHSSTGRTAPPRVGNVYEPTLCLGLGVIDAPLIVYDVATHAQTEATWIRVVRHEPPEQRGAGRRSFAVDVIHVDHLASFIDVHVQPFAESFAERVQRAHSILARGVAHMNRRDWSWRDLLDES